MTPEEAKELARLLGKVARSGYYFPDPAFQALHGVVSMWAPELVIAREGARGKEVLLTKYKGGAAAFKGKWHIPGGYNTWSDSGLDETCDRIAKRELGVGVKYKKTLDVYRWMADEHPYGRPLSLFVECDLLGEIKENNEMRFFSKDALQENIVPCHRRFLDTYFV